MSTLRTLDDVAVSGKTVLLRVDLNVPMNDGEVGDLTRVERILPTIQELKDKGAVIVLLSHFGRPKGKPNPAMSLGPLARPLVNLLSKFVTFVPTDWRDTRADEAVAGAKPGDVILMENTRFHPGEEKNDPELAGKFASLGDVYVNDAFSAAHRAHASTEGIAKLLPAAAGRAMQAEIAALETALTTPKRPVLALVGGAKISTKLDLLANLATKVDGIIIGGGMANTFLAAQGIPIGKSLCEHDLLDTARDVMQAMQKAGCEPILPVDAVVAGEFAAGADNHVADLDKIAADDMILDAGPKTVEGLKARVQTASTLVWNGPLGAFEIAPFDAATTALATFAAERTQQGKLISVAGGGDTVAALMHAQAADKFTYISTAGGAFLEWLEGKELPGVKALQS